MTYNESDIAKHVKRQKRDFFIKLISSLLLILLSALLIAFFPEVTLIFICAVLIIISIAYAVKTVIRYHPGVLFSGEIKGVNVKEHEFVVTNRRLSFGMRRSFSRIRPANTASNKRRTKPPTSAIVYLRLKDGNVTYIDKLFNAQTDIYEIGDTLYKYPGTRFPIILNREVEAMPCPLCGTANKNTEPHCITCGLKIEN